MNLNATLSKREIEMVPYLISQMTKKQIADKIFRSVRTVENHARTIYGKTDVHTKSGLCIWFFVQHFKIPIEALPDSMIAMVFLVLFIPFEFFSFKNTITSSRIRTEEFRTFFRSKRNEDLPVIEF